MVGALGDVSFRGRTASLLCLLSACVRVWMCTRVCVCVSERYSDPIKCCDAGMEEALVLNDCHILISPEAL